MVQFYRYVGHLSFFFLFIAQGDIQAKYESIDKDTPIPTDRQVTYLSKIRRQ